MKKILVSFEAKRKVNTLGVTREIHREISGLVKRRRRRRKQDGTERKSMQRSQLRWAVRKSKATRRV